MGDDTSMNLGWPGPGSAAWDAPAPRRSRARRPASRFSDVAGQDEAKELEEIVSLEHPDKYGWDAIGARCPRGAPAR